MMRWLWVATAVAVGTISVLAPPATAQIPQSPKTLALSYAGDFPDPFVLVAGGTYYAYATASGPAHLQEMSSTDLATWGPVSDALPTLPAWSTPGRTWAPSVLSLGGTYVLYYTTEQSSSGRQCVSVATSQSGTPAGPFTDNSTGPLVCQLTLGGSIDPYGFADSSGTPYLIWKSDNNAFGNPTSLWAQRLTGDGLAFATRTSPTKLLTVSSNSSWESAVIEGPAMTASRGTYYLFYGGGTWNSTGAGIGYATCFSVLGPCRDQAASAPWLGTSPSGTPPVGPQGPTVFTDTGGHLRMGLAGWNGAVGYVNGGVRSLWTDTLSFVNGKPALG